MLAAHLTLIATTMIALYLSYIPETEKLAWFVGSAGIAIYFYKLFTSSDL